jgi:ankyrin repeat protein
MPAFVDLYAIWSTMHNIVASSTWDLYEECLQSPRIDLNSRDEQGRAVIHHLMHHGTPEHISRLVNDHTSVNINRQDFSGLTALHFAVLGSRLDMIRTLLDLPNIRLDLIDNEGRTPLALTSYWGFKTVALALIDHSAAFPLPQANQLSALVLAAK